MLWPKDNRLMCTATLNCQIVLFIHEENNHSQSFYSLFSLFYILKFSGVSRVLWTVIKKIWAIFNAFCLLLLLSWIFQNGLELNKILQNVYKLEYVGTYISWNAGCLTIISSLDKANSGASNIKYFVMQN